MENEIINVVSDVPAISDDRLVDLANAAEKRVDAMQKIKRVALRMTNPHDWVDQNGKPYLQSSGAEKIARLFGISWRIDEPTLEHEEGGHYGYTYKGYFTLAGVTIEAIGSRSSKDGFFRKYGKDRQELPPSAIDKGDVKKSAYTNCIGNGITRLLGIRNLTYADLEDHAGIKKEHVTRVDYKKAGEKHEDANQDTSKISDAQRKRFYAICKTAGKTDTEVKAYLKEKTGSESTSDIPRKLYDEVCAWAESRMPGQEG